MERAVEDVVRRVRQRVHHDVDQDELGVVAREETARRAEEGRAGRAEAVSDEAELERRVRAELSGFGLIQPLLDDPSIEEIWINAPDRVFVSTGEKTYRVPLALSSQAVREIVERMLQPTGRRLDLSSPFVDASLPDGSRLHVVIPDITAREWSVNIRKFMTGTHDLVSLRRKEMISDEAIAYLERRVGAGGTLVVSGATHTGKTTVLAAALNQFCEAERVITAEETFELLLTMTDRVGLQSRAANLEGTGAVTLRRLVTEALRMRPDRLVIGEVRGAEALDLLIAANTGVPSGCTIHASSAEDALRKLTLLPLLAGANIDRGFVVECIAAGVDTVVHLSRDAHGRRQVAEIAHPVLTDGVLRSHLVFALMPGNGDPRLHRIDHSEPRNAGRSGMGGYPGHGQEANRDDRGEDGSWRRGHTSGRGTLSA
ncbi:MAG: CpaF family protein [Mycetocola sp.]